jgi:alpha-2-macroglobulin
MKRIARLLLPSAYLGFIFAGCNPNGNLKVTEVNFPDGEVQTQQAIVFTFNKDLVPDSIMHKWDSSAYMDIQPAVRGVYEWLSPNQLSFSPSESFLPNTDYKVLLTKKLLIHSKKSMGIDEKPISFHTPYLKIENVETFWTIKDGNASLGIFVGVNIDFNYMVSPPSVLQKLKLTAATSDVQPELVSADNNKQVRLLFKPAEGASYPCQLSVSVDKGIACVGSQKLTEKALEYASQIPPQDEFEVVSALPVFQNGESYISVQTSQPLADNDIEQFIHLTPDAKIKITNQSNGFFITGDFSGKADYDLTISPELKSIFGKELKTGYHTTIHFGSPPPFIGFTDKNSIYLSSQGNRNLAMQIVSVPKVKFSIYKIYENNILFYLKNGKNYESFDAPSSDEDQGSDDNAQEGNDDDNGYHYIDDYSENPDYGDVLVSREFNTSTLPKSNGTSLLNINLADLNYDATRKGIYLVTVQDKKKPWVQDRKLLVVSDIGMIVKKGEKNITVFCHSLVNAEKMEGVKVSFLSNNNQDIYTAVTDNDGTATFVYDKAKFPGNDVVAVTARYDKDFNFMSLNYSGVEVSKFQVGGKTTDNVPYDVFIYSNRDIYRPGDTINVNSIVRTFGWETVKDVPVKFKVKMPNGRQLQEIKGKLDAEGSCAINFSVPSAAMTGSYTLEMYSGNDVMLNDFSFMVEEFMPQRIKVDLQMDKKDFESGTTAKIDVQAMELFGPPAANKNYDATCDIDFGSFYSDKLPDYTFNIVRPTSTNFSQLTDNGTTDDKGHAKVEFQLPEDKNIGMLTGRAIVSVFDETGRPVNRSEDFKIYTQNVFYGIKNFESWVSTNKQIDFGLVAANKKGDAVSARAYVSVIKHYYETVLTHTYSGTRYESQERTKTVFFKNMDVSGTSSFVSFLPQESGEYEIRVSSDASSESYVTHYFYAYGSGSTDYNSFQVSKEGNVEIKSDKSNYKPGETANILFTCPFDGKLVVTVEQNEVLEKYYVETDHKAASLKVPISKGDLPGIYVCATLIRELSDNSIPLTVARGFQPIKVDEPDDKLDVKIIAADNSRSKTDQTVHIKTLPNSEVTIGAVDEGTLLITNFKTPDPYAYFYAMRALEVKTFDLYPLVLPELAFMSSMAGDEGMAGRLPPSKGKCVHPVAYWSGPLKADGNGDCSFTFHIPDFSGSIRLEAVAYKGEKFGSNEKNMIVADPIVISTSLPRFMSPDDDNQLNVILSNTTANNASAVATVAVGGPLKITGSATQSIEIPAHSERTVTYDLVAQPGLDAGTLNISVKALHETFTDHEELPVRPPTPLEKVSDGGVVKGGENANVTFSDDFVEGTSKGYIVVSKSPMTQFTKHMNDLLDYPYGCMEQTISIAFPALYYSSLMKATGQKDVNQRYNPDYIINEAIKKIYAQQQYNGGLTYWPGGDYVNWWISDYGLHFLLEAKRMGYEVDNTVMTNLEQYIQSQVNTKQTENYTYYDADGKLQQRVIVPEEVFYSLYVLALANHPDISVMNYFKNEATPLALASASTTHAGMTGQNNLLSLDSKYMLAATYALTGDKKAFSTLLPSGFSGERATRSLSGNFGSYLRDESISLDALLQAQPDNPQIPILAKHISEELKQEQWLSTQEASFALIALGKLSENALKSNATATLWINGVKVGELGASDVSFKVKQDISNKKVEIRTTGSGYVYYYYESQGIPTGNKFKEEDSYLKVRKTFYNTQGVEISDMHFKQNQLIVVKVSIESLDNSDIDNVAITDVIPACFEIENPRLNPEREFSWIKDKEDADYMDIRDDRVTYFTNVTAKKQDYYYLVRVVAKGKYVMGPVAADAMYDGSYHSYNGSGHVDVQ